MSDLQAIDERCREIAVAELGFDVPDVIYHLVRPEEVYFAAANGLPARYSSARWGAQFDAEYGRYQRGEGRIYELIFNTRPVHAYLMEGNSLVAQTLVIAHCLGHGYVFETNGWLGAVDRTIMPRVLSAAERIADYMARARARPRRGLPRRLPRDRRPPAPGAAHPQGGRSEPEHRRGPLRRAVPRRGRRPTASSVAAERDALRRRFPREPQQDLLGFIEQHARALEDWQRDVISIVHSEQSYFLPQMRTRILNEGAAVLTHQEICQRLFLPADQYWEYEQLNAAVIQPHPGRVNPYNLGINILREIMRIATEPDDEERDRWSWAGDVDPFEQVRSVLRDYDDEALLREFLTPKVCVLSPAVRLRPRPAGPAQDPHLLARGGRDPRHPDPAALTFGIPHIEIVDADYRGRGELLLEHRHEGIGLDPEYARGTLTQVAALWGKPCTVKTINGRDTDAAAWFTGHPDGRSLHFATEPA